MPCIMERLYDLIMNSILLLVLITNEGTLLLVDWFCYEAKIRII